MTGLWVAALLAGLLGSPHCVGMCGGIVTAFGMSLREQTPAQKIRLTLLYHAGRLLSYALLGLLAGLMGMALLQPLAHTAWPRIVVAAALILIGLSMLGLPLLSALERLGARLWQAMAPLRQRLFPIHTAPRALGAGLLWGFLPCGLVYGALLTAAASGDTLQGAGLMLVFGLGTMPLLLLTGAASQTLGQRLRQWRPLMGMALILGGLWTLWMPVMGQGHGGHHAPAGGHSVDPAAASEHRPDAQVPSMHLMPDPAKLRTPAHSVDDPVTTTHHETHQTH